MRHLINTSTITAVTAGLAFCAALLITRRPPCHAQAAPQQLDDAHRAGYSLALTHVSRGLLRAAPEEP